MSAMERPRERKKTDLYLYNPLDLAIYIKWSNLSGKTESRFIESMWALRHTLLSKTKGMKYEQFQRKVYDQLFFLWSRGFVDEHASLAFALDEKSFPASLLPKRQALLEQYLKLLAIHLIQTPRLPAISIRWDEVMERCHVKKLTKTLWKALELALPNLQLAFLAADGSQYQESNFLNGDGARLALHAARTKPEK